MAYAGCDLGIASAKVVIVENRKIIASEVLPYTNLPRQAANNVMQRALAQAGISRERIGCCLATGFGKAAVPYADEVVPETVSVLRAVLNPMYQFVADIDKSPTLAASEIQSCRGAKIRNSASKRVPIKSLRMIGHHVKLLFSGFRE